MSSTNPGTPRTPRTTGATPIGDGAKKRPWWLLALLAIAALLVLLLLLSQCGGDDDDDDATPSGGSTRSTAPTTSATSEPSAPASSKAPASSAAPATPADPAAPAGGGNLTAGSTSLLPLADAAPDGTLTAYISQPATAQGVQVLTVPADEGFWVGTSDTDRVWVQLSGTGESGYQVQPGDLVDFTGTVIGHSAGFAEKVGVTEEEGGGQLTSEAAHIAAERSTVMLSAS